MNDEIPTTVRDTSGAQYTLSDLLGEGGQGAVYRIKGRDLALKLGTHSSAKARTRTQETIERIKRLPLKGLHFARPLRALAPPHTGYVMELMTGMESLSKLIDRPRDQGTDIVPWYIETGSLRRRLRVLAASADALAGLHADGMSYGDASPANIYISEGHEGREAWFIDCDNITQGVNRRAVLTPGFGAPELYQSQGSDSLTDAWSFAIIAFKTLCAVHPFNGDRVHDGPPELEEQAFRGELPWIGDPDGGNETDRGLPRDMVLTRPLAALSKRCFGESRRDREKRPGVRLWAEKLHQAADQTLVCAGCESSFYLNQAHCPWCGDPRPGFALVSSYHRDLELTDKARNPSNLVGSKPAAPEAVAIQALQMGSTLGFDAALHAERSTAPADLEVAVTEGQLTLRSPGAHPWLLRSKDGRENAFGSGTKALNLSALRTGSRPWWVFPTAPESVHRVLSFEWFPAEQS